MDAGSGKPAVVYAKIANKRWAICRSFDVSDGLELATSGVTVLFGCGQGGSAVAAASIQALLPSSVGLGLVAMGRRDLTRI
jgi:hypothetical protein